MSGPPTSESNPYASPDAESAPRSRREQLQQRGFIYVCICAGLMVAMSLLAMALTLVATGEVNLIRLGFTAILIVFMLLRQSWARWTTVVLLALGVFYALYWAGLLLMYGGLILALPIGLVVVVYGGICLTLAFSPSVNLYYDPHRYRTAGRIHRRQPQREPVQGESPFGFLDQGNDEPPKIDISP